MCVREIRESEWVGVCSDELTAARAEQPCRAKAEAVKLAPSPPAGDGPAAARLPPVPGSRHRLHCRGAGISDSLVHYVARWDITG